MNQEKEKSEAPQPKDQSESKCSCFQDPFAILPPEVRPPQRTWMDDLRQVTCPGCGFQYWTNRKTDLCVDCEKMAAQNELQKMVSDFAIATTEVKEISEIG
jgi:hypothetical protein